MKYDTTFINRNFLLKVYGVDSENRRINRLVGVSGLVGLIGVELTEKFITRALNSKKDSVKCCLRRGLWKIQCKLPPKTKRFCPLVLK